MDNSKKLPELMKTSDINGNIDKCAAIFGPGSQSLVLLSDTAFQCLLHASKHGDVTLCERLYMSLGGVAKGRAAAAVRVEALKSWFAKMGPMTAVKGKWKIKDTADWRNPELWKLEEALAKPFWEEMGAETRPFEFSNLMKVIEGLVKRIDKGADEGTLKGDPVVLKAWANNVIKFAKVTASDLTPGQKGETDDNLDVIKAAVEKGVMSKTETDTGLITEEVAA